MSGFDLLWNGSLYEGQSNTILEAMSLGVPVVASDIPGNRDLVVEGETGSLFDLGDIETLVKCSNQLLRDDAKRDQYGAAAKRRIQQHFALEKMISAYEQLYSELHDKACQAED